MDTTKFRDLLYDKDEDGIVTVTLNNPEKKNSITGRTALEFWWTADHFEKDETAYALIITGTENQGDKPLEKNAFCAGANFADAADFSDLTEEEKAPQDPRDAALKGVVLKFNQLEKPVIAAMNGYGIGVGFTMPLSCADLIYLSETGWLRLPFVGIGIVPEAASTYFLPQRVGAVKANEILLFGNDISAQEALELGLCNGICHQSEVIEMAKQAARKLIPPNTAFFSVKKTKAALRATMMDGLSAALDRENAALHACLRSNDFRESMTAKMEKRPPRFTGN